MTKRRIALFILIPMLIVLALGIFAILAVQLSYGQPPSPAAQPLGDRYDYPLVGSYQQFAPSYIWHYAVIHDEIIDTIVIDAGDCFITEAGTWSNWTPTVHIDLAIWGQGSHLEWDYSKAYWYPGRRISSFYFLTLTAPPSTTGTIHINGEPHEAIVPDCAERKMHLPMLLKE